MKKLFLSLLMLATVYNLLAQTTISDPNVEKRTVGSYHGIDVATGIQLVLTAGNTEEVAVSASKTEYRDKIITKVENGVLKLYYETKTGAINRKNDNKELKAYVSYKTLDKLEVTTGAQVKINGVLKSASLELKSNTGGQVNGEIDISSLKVKQNTGSKITLSGTSETLDVDGDTGSKFLGEGLRTVNCTASAGTGAQVTITVEKELSAKADTGGNIKYKGSASIRNVKTHTGGSITKI